MRNIWKVHDYNPSEGVRNKTFAPDFDDRDWPTIEIPGDVHSFLIDNNLIDNPFYDRNEEACRWVEEKEWWHRRKFIGDEQRLERDERLFLVFHGIDTFATIWFNGREIGRTKNMFRKYEFDVSDLYLFGESNTIAVCIDPPLMHKNNDLPFESWGPNPERVSLRKAQYQYGWDWGPRLPNVGLWRPVEIKRRSRTFLQDVHFYTLDISAYGKKALIAVDVHVQSIAFAKATVRIRLQDKKGTTVVEEQRQFTLDRDAQQERFYLTVENPHLWWTHDLGEPHLYQLHVLLADAGQKLDAFEQRVGIRTIELDQSPDFDEPGARFFRFKLNGAPIFARGANWIPADSFVARLTRQKYQMLLRKAVSGNMNMLRVWGGGIYEHDRFYELCNELGLLVWQDFMFACAPYPEEPEEFVDEVRQEAVYQVNRLKNHPCLALWCGNNENQWIQDKLHWQEPNHPLPGALYYHNILPEVVAEQDGRTPYWPGSPYGGDDHNSTMDGDRHNWWVWHGDLPRRFGEKPEVDQSPKGVAYTNYAKDMGRFISEFGMHASPVHETLKRCIPADQLWFHSPSMDHHNKDNPKNKGDNLMLPVTGLPNNLDEYIDYSMIAQAEGLKFAIEHFRRRTPHCSGALIWQFNDCWPCLSWSLVDYYGFEKAGYFFAQRAFAPILASLKPLDDGGVEVWLTNDTLAPVSDTIIVRHTAFDGKVEWQKKAPIIAPANAGVAVCTLPKEELVADAWHYLTISSLGKLFPKNRHFFVMIKDLKREQPSLNIERHIVDDRTIRCTIATRHYAYFVHFDIAQESLKLSDNYFDLEPGEIKTVTIEHDGTFDPADFQIKAL